MLNILSSLETAVSARAGSSLGACLPGRVGTVDQGSTGVMVRPRPRAVSPAGVFGHGRTAAFQGTAAGRSGHSQPSGQQNNCEKYVHTTRITAPSGGAPGLQPRRDPV
jgi:hypothetical protein